MEDSKLERIVEDMLNREQRYKRLVHNGETVKAESIKIELGIFYKQIMEAKSYE